jgi:uncharacterized protein
MASALFERLQSDLKTAMRSGDDLARNTLRMAISEAKNKKIELLRELEDVDVEAVLRRAVKTRLESAEEYAKHQRPELAEREQAEARILGAYLPQTMTEDEARAAVRAVIERTGAGSKKELGMVMKAVLAEHPGRLDGKLAQRLAGELLP